MKKQLKWILKRDERVTNIFKNRREAVKYFKKILEQTLKDFSKQDSNDEYDYSIIIPKIEIIPIEEREAFLSLL